MQQLLLPRRDLEVILNDTAPLWEEMRGQRLFLTGGTGFFGTWLLSSFLYINRELALGAHATVLTRDPAAFAAKASNLATDPAVSLLQGDIRAFSPPPGHFDFLVHAATDVVPGNTPSPLERYSAIADGTARILDFAQKKGVRKFLLTSSGAVYGRQPDDMTHTLETYLGAPDPLDPAAAYGEAKRVSELMCALYAQRSAIEFKIARCFVFAGPGLPLDANFAIGNFIRDAIAGRPIQVKGDGSGERSYLYASDLATWLWTILFRGPSMRVYNVGAESAITIADLAFLTAATLNPSVPVHIASVPAINQMPQRYVPATARAAQELGLRSTVDLIESIRRTAEFNGFKAR
jgi:dTDP-glucose 4,6-dehydratase